MNVRWSRIRRKVVLNAVVLLFASGLMGAQAASAEKILSLISDATLTDGGKLIVNETIDLDKSGGGRKAIFRAIPTSIDENGVAHHFAVKVHSVTDGNGHKVPFSAKEHHGSIGVRIDTAHGDVSRQQFRIDYEARGVTNCCKQVPQLYFPFTGHEWPFPIEKVEAIVRLPRGVHLSDSDVRAWQGLPGSVEKPASTKVIDDRVLATASNLPPGAGLTVEINFPPGAVQETGFFDHLEWIAQDWYLLVVLPLVAMAGLGFYRLARQRRASKVVDGETSWKAPGNLSPVELGTLIDGSCDVHDLTGILLDLAVRGFYTIREIPATGFFNLADRDYEFRKQAPPHNESLKEYETIFMEALFGNAQTAYLSNVQGVFRQFVPQIKESIYKSLVANGLLMKNPEKDRRRFYTIGFSMCCAGIALLFLYGEEVYAKAAGLGFVAAGALVAVAQQFVPLLTEKGKDTIDKVHEFAESLRTAESRNLSQWIDNDEFLFHRLLPYAMVLGVSEKWAAACENHIPLWPDWFQFHRGSQQPGPFSPSDFARDVWIASKIAGLTFFAPPPVQYSSYAVGKSGRKEQEHDVPNK